MCTYVVDTTEKDALIVEVEYELYNLTTEL